MGTSDHHYGVLLLARNRQPSMEPFIWGKISSNVDRTRRRKETTDLDRLFSTGIIDPTAIL